MSDYIVTMVVVAAYLTGVFLLLRADDKRWEREVKMRAKKDKP